MLSRILSTLFGNWRWAVALALLVGAALSWHRFSPEPYTWGDNARFIILSESIAGGHGYRLINEPDSPEHVAVPPGYPLLLAPFSYFAPRCYPAMKLLTLAFFLGTIPLTFLLAARYLSRPAAAVAVLLTAWEPLLINYSDAIMSEIPYLFFSLLALLLLERTVRAPDRPGWGAVLPGALATAAAIYLRSVGLTLAAAASVGLFLKGRGRQAFMVFVVIVAAYYPWVLRNRAQEGAADRSYFSEFLAIDPYRPALGPVRNLDEARRILGRRVRNNYHLYQDRVLPDMVLVDFAILVKGLDQDLQHALALVLSLPLFLGLGALLWRGHWLPGAYAVFLFLLLLFWPWAEERFFLPLVPLMMIFSVTGLLVIRDFLFRLAARLAKPLPAWVRWGLSLVAAFGLIGLTAWQSWNMKAHRAEGNWRLYRRAGIWLRENTPPGTLIICRKPFLLHLYSERSTLPQWFGNDHREVLAHAVRSGADYVVVGVGLAHEEFLARAMIDSDSPFLPVHWHEHEQHNRRIVVWRHRRLGPATPAESALWQEMHDRYLHLEYETERIHWHQVGEKIRDRRASGRRAWAAPADTEGFLVFGPYHLFLPGNFRAVFRLAVESPAPAGTVATLDVTGDHGRRIYARRELTAAEFGPDYLEVPLDFSLGETAELEFRIQVHGRGEVRADRIAVHPAQ